MTRRALITGITGQDGSYLAELLLAQGLRSARPHPPLQLVCHRAHRASLPGSARDGRSADLHYGDLTDSSVAGQTHQHACSPTRSTTSAPRATSRVSFEMPEYTADADAHGHVAAAGGDPRMPARRSGSTRPAAPRCSAWCGETPQSETTPFYPRSPYAVGQGLRPLHDDSVPRGATASSPATASSSTTNRPAAATRSSRAR